MEYFLFSILFGLLFYFIGHVFSSFWRKHKDYTVFETFFFKLVTGVLFALVFYSTLKTKGNTIFGGIILISIVYFFFNKDRLKIPRLNEILKIEVKPLLLFFIITLLFTALFRHLIFPDLINIHPDFYYFGSISDYLNIYAIETGSLKIIGQTPKPSFYHYSNEWLTALIAASTNNVGSVSMVYIYLPLIITILYFGIFSIAQKITKYNFYSILLLTFVFFILTPLSRIGGLDTILSIGNFDISFVTFFSNPATIKLALVTVLFTFSILAFRKERIIDTVFIYLIITYIWPTTTIAIFGGVFLFLIYLKAYKKDFIAKEFTLLILSVSYFLIFYFLQSFPRIETLSTSSFSRLDMAFLYLENEFDVFQHIKYFIGTFVIRFYYYAIFLIILFVNWRLFLKYKERLSEYNQYVLLYGFVFFCGLLGKSALYFLTDSNQIFENIMDHTFIYILIFITLIVSLERKFNYIFVFILLISASYTHYTLYSKETKYQENRQISETLSQEFKGKNVKFASHIKAQNSLFRHPSQRVYPPLTFMRAYSNSYFPVDFSVYDRYKHQYEDEVDFTKRNRFLANKLGSPFYSFIESNKIDTVNWEAKYLFLKTHKFDYLVVEKGSLSEQDLSQLVVEKNIKTYDDAVELLKLKW